MADYPAFLEKAEKFAQETLESERAGTWKLYSLGRSTFLGWNTVTFIATCVDLDGQQVKIVIDEQADGLRYSDCAI